MRWVTLPPNGFECIKISPSNYLGIASTPSSEGRGSGVLIDEFGGGGESGSEVAAAKGVKESPSEGVPPRPRWPLGTANAVASPGFKTYGTDGG